MIIAIVPAAGFSQRMGCPKLSLPFRGRTVLEHVVRALREGGADSVVVVVGPHVPELLPLAKAAGAHVCQLAEPTPDMRATVEHGLRWIEKAFSPRPGDGWLLAPADHPSLDPAVVREIVERYRSDPAKSIVIPAHAGPRGHPVLIAWRHVASLHRWPAESGINAFLRAHEAEVAEIAMSNPCILRDLDTAEEYARLLTEG